MRRHKGQGIGSGRPDTSVQHKATGAPGKSTLVEQLYGGVVQRRAAPGGADVSRYTGELASRLHTPPVALPYRSELEAQFGQPLDDIEAHVGEDAAVTELAGKAAAEGNVVAFADTSPDRATVAHEVTHVLQARSGKPADHAGAEAEADRAKDSVAAGKGVGPITQGAAGIHLDSGMKVDPEDITAREFLKEMISVPTVALGAVRFSKAAQLHPMAPYIEGDLFDAIFANPSIREHVHPFEDKIDGLIAPEAVEPIVDKARAARMQFGAGAGPAHHVYIDSVGIALGNAITRKLQQSITRMLPRVVQASNPRKVGKDIKGEDWWVDDGPPAASSLVVSHPMDRAVTLGLCSRDITIDTGKFAADHPGLVKTAADQVRASRPITLKFPWERNLWHWVEASPSDATAEEVARELFGSEDQAYRLSPMAPLFGFRGSDVAKFVPAKKKELDDLAAAHHPHPHIANRGEIAAVTHSHTEAERIQQIKDASRPPGRIDLNDPMFAKPEIGIPGGVDPAFPRMQQQQQQQPEHGQPAPQPPAPIKVFPAGEDVDPAAELAEAQGGEKLTKERAKLAAAASPTGKKHDEASVYERATDCVDLIEQAKQPFVALGVPTRTLEKHLGALQRTQREAVQTCFVDPEGEFALLDQQAKVLKRIAQGAMDAAAHLTLYGGISKQDGAVTPQMADIPDFAKGPLIEAGQAYESAASALAFPELATPRVAHAEHLTKMLRIAVLEQSLHETRPTLQNAMDTPGDRHKDGADYDPSQLETRNSHLLIEMSRARVMFEADPGQAEKAFTGTQERAGDYTFEVANVSNLEALDSVWATVEGTEDFWKSGMDTLIGDELQRKNRAFYKKFKDEVYTPYKEGVAAKDAEKKKNAKAVFKKLVESDEFKHHFAQVQQHLVDDAKHKKWTKIIVGIAIAVVAMGLGQWYFGAALAAGGSVLGAAVGAAVIETGVSTVLNKIILDADPTAGSLITGLVGAGAMYTILGKALTVGRAAGASIEVAEAATKASMLQKAGKLAGDLTKELIMVQAIGMVQGQIANMIDHGKLLTADQLKEMFVHNIAGLVGMKIGQRLVDVTIDPMKPLRDLGRQHSIDIDGLGRERDDLIKLAKKVEETTDPGMRKQLAEQLVQREQALLENLRETRDRLIELAAKHPGKVNAARLKDLKAMPERVQDAEIMQAQAMMSLEEIGPNLYRADAKAFDSILALHKEAGDKLVGVHTDRTTGLRSLEFKTPDGSIVKIKEKLGDVGDRAAPPVPAAEAKRFEDWLDSAFLHPDMVVAAEHRQRLRDYYARDPVGAMHIAERHGFMPQSMPETSPLAQRPVKGGPEHPTVKPKSEADRAFDQHLHEARGDQGPKMSRLGDEPMMSRSDFEAMYKAGFEYDPVTRKWVLAEGKTAAGTAGKIPPELAREVTTVVGSVHSEAVGHQMLRKLVNGEAEALRMVGIEPPPGFDTRGSEWALGRRISDGEIVLIKGDKAEVNWADIPGVQDIAHSHPLNDPVTGKPRLLEGADGRGVVNIRDLASFGIMDLIHLMPSAGDLRYAALNHRPGHRVHTPYVSLGNGKIGNPVPGHNLDTVEFVFAKSEPHALNAKGSDMIVWKAELHVYAGDTLLGTIELYQKRIVEPGFRADLPTLHPEPQWVPIPADHPVRSAVESSTPTSTTSNIGKVSGESVQKLIGMQKDPSGVLKPMLESLNQKQADLLGGLIEHARPGGRITEGFDQLLQRLGTDRMRAGEDMAMVKSELDADPTATVKFDGEGKPLFSSATRSDIPADVVLAARKAIKPAQHKVKGEFADEAVRAQAVERVETSAQKAGEDAYANAQKAGKSHDEAMKDLEAAAAKEVDAASQREIDAAERAAAAKLAAAIPPAKEAPAIKAALETSGFGKKIDEGGFGTIYEVPGHPDVVIKLPTKDVGGRMNRQLAKEAMALQALQQEGLPTSYRGTVTWTDSGGVVRTGLLMDNLSGAAMSKVVLQQGKLAGEPIPPGHKELVNARTVKDLENVRDTGLAKKIDLEDLQFMITQDGSIELIDPARVTFLEKAGLKKREIEKRLEQFEKRMNQIIRKTKQIAEGK